MITVNVLAAKTNLSRLLSQMEKRGEPVLICRNGKPVVEI
jgi:antitoxin (DNA-binding transcriptional repressor) of toxin-antitoxin stability system